MTDTAETTVDAVAVAKTLGKAVTKELAYQAGVHVAAVSILLGIGYGVKKVQERRAKKAVLTVVEQ